MPASYSNMSLHLQLLKHHWPSLCASSEWFMRARSVLLQVAAVLMVLLLRLLLRLLGEPGVGWHSGHSRTSSIRCGPSAQSQVGPCAATGYVHLAYVQAVMRCCLLVTVVRQPGPWQEGIYH